MQIIGGTILGGTIKDGVLSSALYAFTTFQFTNGNSIGRTGPTLGNLSYSNVGNAWISDTNYFNVVTRGIQLWTVPETASYNITVAGASGGNNFASTTGNIGGRGALLTTTVSLNKGQQISIVVGQRGQDRSNVNSSGFALNGASGGGGTFVYDAANVVYYAVAGGGGGAGIITNNFSGNVQDARHNSVWGGNVVVGAGFYANGGGIGLGGNVSNRPSGLYGGPGAGILGYGANVGQSVNVGLAGQGPAGNWLGGNIGTRASFAANTLVGGFGGGGGAGIGDNNYTSGFFAGGGGGYSGGGAGGNSGNANSSNGGAGGSYYAGILVNGTSAANFGNGYVIITKL